LYPAKVNEHVFTERVSPISDGLSSVIHNENNNNNNINRNTEVVFREIDSRLNVGEVIQEEPVVKDRSFLPSTSNAASRVLNILNIDSTKSFSDAMKLSRTS